MNKVLDRLLSVNWKLQPEHKKSQLELLSECFRCQAHWFVFFEVPEKWPSYDVAAIVDPTLRAPESDLQVFRKHIASYKFGIHYFNILVNSVHWGHLSDSTDLTRFGLPDPFEPLLVFYERGGQFDMSYELRMITSHDMSFFLGDCEKWYKPVPFIALDKASLDMVDNK